jgi:nitroimidazol reductase NimA-like FMN-containing flavoprotein (pyridoxamine 5'-phosphate oxidase superfamily)
MSLAMTQEEREAFLADLHVGVISIEQDGKPPLSAPIWYDYSPGAGLWVITGDTSLKARHLRTAGRFTLVAQTEEPPTYRYVSVAGPVVETRKAEIEADVRPMARRYFGDAIGDQYAEATGAAGQTVFVMRPDRWRTVDYRKSALG